jgi:hypothetical protein
MTQSKRIIKKFGGARQLAQALCALPDKRSHRHWSVVYRWSWNGYIPTSVWPALLQAARLNGIYLTEEDMSPRNQEVA